jgi:type III restriction enzyme
MQLKDYQTKVIEQFSNYLELLEDAANQYLEVAQINPKLAMSVDYTNTAWTSLGKTSIHKSRRNGLNKYIPNVCLKVPTGGGKTILATHCIDKIQHHFLKRKTGVVLWIVPSSSIYTQTIKTLNDRNHPYRQVLDRCSGGRTMIIEKKDRLSQQDTNENLVVIMLMLQSSNRENKESLKMYQLSGGYQGFFPSEDEYDLHQKLLNQIPNLDTIGEENDFFGKLVTPSFGNCLRMIQPLVILDEGHKTYSTSARATVDGFNPCFILELSATPTEQSNVLVQVSGRDLEREDMIKLPIRIENRLETDWKLIVAQAKKTRDRLEKLAQDSQQNTNQYIRPIQLIQVERTGKDQRNSGWIHSEDVKAFLLSELGVNSQEIAIKSSDKDDVEGLDLLSPDCHIRYIITKSALQEGWDCSFAYVLTVLGASQSLTAMTQLIGRVLRQPGAVKSKIPELNECHIITYKQSTDKLIKGIKDGLEDEGLGDVMKSVYLSEESSTIQKTQERIVYIRDKFKHFEGQVFLPKFVVKLGQNSEDLDFERDILSRIDWGKLTLDFVDTLILEQNMSFTNQLLVNFSDKSGFESLTGSSNFQMTKADDSEIDGAFVTRQLQGIIPNPWLAYEFTQNTLNLLQKRYNSNLVVKNLIFIIEEIKKNITNQVDRLCETIFREMLENDIVRFVLISTKGGFTLPKSIKTSGNSLPNNTGTSLAQASLFDAIGEDDFNNYERSVAMYFERQSKMLWWHRNIVGKTGYYLQGWEKSKIYPDFIYTTKDPASDSKFDKVYVLETKGDHLIGSKDTSYKQSIFDLCNNLSIKKDWNELIQDNFEGKEINFQLVNESDWENNLRQVFK